MGLTIKSKRRGGFILTITAVFALVAQPLYGVIASQVADAAPYGARIVRSNALDGWNSGNASGGNNAFVADSQAPYGNGALELTTTSADASRAQRTKSISPNVKLADVQTLSYWTKYVSGPAHAGAALQITINGLSGVSSSSSTTLVYEPYWNGAVATDGQWQQWNTLAGGKFWSTTTIAGFANGSGGAPFYTIDQALAMHPNAKITSLKLNIGTYNQNWVVRADGVNLGGTVYDFEPAAPVSQLVGENFNTVDDPYKGISVGFRAEDFGTVSTVSVDIERADGSIVTKTANQAVRDLISNNPDATQLTAPFIIQEGTFTEAGDVQYWAPAPSVWTAATAPVKATIKVTDQNGTKTAVISMLSQGVPSWPTYASLLPIGIPTLISPSDNAITKDRNFSMTWNTVSDATVYEYRTAHTLVDATTLGPIIYSDTSASSNYSINGGTVTRGNSGTPDADYYWQVRAGDGSGNWGPWSAIGKVTVDNLAPTSTNDLGSLVRGSLVIHQTVNDNTQPASGKLRIWKQNSDGSLDNSKFYASANAVTTDSAGVATYMLNTASQLYGDGKYTAKFTSRDAAGNESVQEKVFTVDNTAPTVTVKPGAIGTAASKTFSSVSFSLYDAYQVDKYVLNGQTVDFTNNTYSDANFQNIKSKLVQGTNTFTLYDVAGNATTYVFTYDTVAPAAPTHQSPVADAIQASNDFWFDWSDVDGAVSYEMQNSQNPATGSNGSFTNVQWTGDYQQVQPTQSKARSVGANGTWYWQVRAVDAAGNKSAWTTPWAVTIDQQPPTALSASITPSPAKSIDAVTLSLSLHDQQTSVVSAKYTIYNNTTEEIKAKNVPIAGVYGAPTVNLATPIDVSTLPTGTYRVQLHFNDAAGNQGKRTLYFVIDNSFVISFNEIASNVPTPTISGQAVWKTGGQPAANQVVSLQIKQGDTIIPVATTATTDADGSWSMNAPTLTSGTYSILASIGGVQVGELTPVVITLPPVVLEQSQLPLQNLLSVPALGVLTVAAALPGQITTAVGQLASAVTLPSGNVVTDSAAQTGVLGSETAAGLSDSKATSDVKGVADEKTANNLFAANWWWLALLLAALGFGWWLIATLRRRAQQNA